MIVQLEILFPDLLEKPESHTHQPDREAPVTLLSFEDILLSDFPLSTALTVAFNTRLKKSWQCRTAGGKRVLTLPAFFSLAPTVVKKDLITWALLDRPHFKKHRAAYLIRKKELEHAPLAFLKNHFAENPRHHRTAVIPQYETQGTTWDLAEVRDTINERCFDNRIQTVIRWGKTGTRLSFQTHKTTKNGTLFNIVTIAGIYNLRGVPRFAIEAIVHHEMLHIAIPPYKKNGANVIHGPEFRKAEKSFVHHDAWKKWQRSDLRSLMKKPRRSFLSHILNKIS